MSSHERTFEAGMIGTGVPSALADGDLEILGLMPNASNYTFLARASHGEETLLAVYKPQRGEMPLWDFPAGTLGRREVAAYVVARELGWPNVPPTVFRDGPEGPGSVQLFIEFDPAQHYFTLEGTRDVDFRRIALFDVVVNNADRKGGHCLLAPDGRIWVIDHGVCFSDEPKLRTVIWAFAGETIEAPPLRDLDALRANVRRGALRDELSAVLSREEIEALRDRLDIVLERRTFPEPSPGRPFPWPPV